MSHRNSHPDLGNPGCFRIDEDVMRLYPHVCRTIFKTFIPRDITHEFYVNTLVYHGYHPEFDPLEDGQRVPFYDCEIVESENGAMSIWWTRHDDKGDERASKVRYTPPPRKPTKKYVSWALNEENPDD